MKNIVLFHIRFFRLLNAVAHTLFKEDIYSYADNLNSDQCCIKKRANFETKSVTLKIGLCCQSKIN